MCPYAGILDAYSVFQDSSLLMSTKDSHLQIALLVQWSHLEALQLLLHPPSLLCGPYLAYDQLDRCYQISKSSTCIFGCTVAPYDSKLSFYTRTSPWMATMSSSRLISSATTIRCLLTSAAAFSFLSWSVMEPVTVHGVLWYASSPLLLITEGLFHI